LLLQGQVDGQALQLYKKLPDVILHRSSS
jgi:hypothetical protein